MADVQKFLFFSSFTPRQQTVRVGLSISIVARSGFEGQPSSSPFEA